MSWFFEDEADPDADLIYRELRDNLSQAAVPDFFFFEVMNSLLTGEKKRRCTVEQADAFYNSILQIPFVVERFSSRDFHEINSLARKHRLTAYDASYLYLSLSGNLQLQSKDIALLRAYRDASSRSE
jgi:predicted nucleic acid-binding protein